VVFVSKVTESAELWHSRSVAEGHLPSNCDCAPFVQQPNERNLMLSCEDAREPVTVNWACLQWLNCLPTLTTHTFYV